MVTVTEQPGRSGRKLSLLVVLALLAASATGCVSFGEPKERGARDSDARNYLRNRAMDARDTVSATAITGTFGGAKVYVGPLGVGLFVGLEVTHGPIGTFEHGLKHGETGRVVLEDYTLGITFQESSRVSRGPGRERAAERGKRIGSRYPSRAANFTRVGFALGLCLGLRVELNVGELADLVLGLFTFDLFDDDVYHAQKSAAVPNAEAPKSAGGPGPAPPGHNKRSDD